MAVFYRVHFFKTDWDHLETCSCGDRLAMYRPLHSDCAIARDDMRWGTSLQANVFVV